VIPEALTLLLDPNRLAVAGSLVHDTLTSEEVAERTGTDHRSVLEAIGQLRRVGLVDVIDVDTAVAADAPGTAEPGPDGYRLVVAELRRLASDLADVDVAMDSYIGFGMTDDEVAVLERFFSGRTLVEIPSSRVKRLVVLERLAQEFDLGRRYGEAEVNDVLRPFHLDVAALRRHLVDEHLLDRDSGSYLRSGGRVSPA
jgi:hypothetical protein